MWPGRLTPAPLGKSQVPAPADYRQRCTIVVTTVHQAGTPLAPQSSLDFTFCYQMPVGGVQRVEESVIAEMTALGSPD